MRPNSWWAAAYLLSSLLVHGAHSHGPSRSACHLDDGAEPLGLGCQAAVTHHAADSDDCPSCASLLTALAIPGTFADTFGTTGGRSGVPVAVSVDHGTVHGFFGRAPPTA